MLKNSKQPSVKVISLLPDSCELLLKFDNYSDFSNSLENKNLLWQDLKTLTCFSGFEKHFNYFDSLLLTDNSLSDLVSDNPVYFAKYSKDNFIITFNLKELADEKVYIEKFAKISEVFLKLNLETEIKNGAIVIASNKTFISQLFNSKNPKLVQNKNYLKLDSETNYSGVSIYVNNTSKAGLFNSSFSNISLKPDRIIFNGIKTADTLSFYGENSAKPSRDYSFLNNIPLICNAFEVFVFENAETTFSKKVDKDWWEKINEYAMFNTKKQFYNNLSGQLVKILMPSKSYALIAYVNDSIKLNEILPFLKDTFKLVQPKVFRLSKGNSSFAGSTFSKLNLNELNFFTVLENAIVFTVNENDAEVFVNAKANNSSILENKRFKQYASKNFDSEFHYINYKLINSLNKEELPFADLLTNDDLSKVKNISHFSYAAIYKNKLLNYRFNLSYLQDNFSDEPNVLWTILADTTIVTKPFLFKNHITQGNEIVYQTSNNQLYLQSATGKIIWKIDVNEKVRSDIYTVDAFKNKKYQLLFNTDKYIHLIDRNGKYVQGFPMKLPSKATNKLCVFDYEGNNDLRLFIACADNKIYNYSIFGVLQDGFKPLQTNNEVTLPIRYSKVGLSDYLITADTKGKIYAFSRKGLGRIDFKNKLIEEEESFDVESGNLLSNTQIIYYDRKGHLLNKISLSDVKEIYKTTESENKLAYCFGDFDKNKITDLIVSYSDKLEVYDLNGTKIFSKDYTDNLNPLALNFYGLSTGNLISVFDDVNFNTTVINIEQKTIKEFKCSQPALIGDLFNDGKTYALMVFNGELTCVKL